MHDTAKKKKIKDPCFLISITAVRILWILMYSESHFQVTRHLTAFTSAASSSTSPFLMKKIPFVSLDPQQLLPSGHLKKILLLFGPTGWRSEAHQRFCLRPASHGNVGEQKKLAPLPKCRSNQADQIWVRAFCVAAFSYLALKRAPEMFPSVFWGEGGTQTVKL